MSDYSAGHAPRPVGPSPKLRLAAVTAVAVGVVLLAGAAFVLSYPGIHQIALHAGVAPRPARLYPLIFDAMVVIAGAAALALRGAGWWARACAWTTLLLMIAAVAAGDALHTTNVVLPAQPTRVVVAVTPWVLLLLAFGLLMAMLHHFRRVRVASAQQNQGPGPAATTGDVAAGQSANGTQDTTSGLDALLGPPEGPSPTMSMARPAAENHAGITAQTTAAGNEDAAGPGDSTGPETGAAGPESPAGAPAEHPTGPAG
jgi:Protein of unknown function (DUF2637)